MTLQTDRLDHRLVTGLLERWFGETGTLHLVGFELGPTPVDWTMITGIFFGGHPIVLRAVTAAEARLLLDLPGIDSASFSSSLLCPSEMAFSAEPAPEHLIFMRRRLVLFVVFSCFCNNNKSTVPLSLVSLVADLDSLEYVDWGAFTFASFLRGMRVRTTGAWGSLTGFWPFLLWWSYEYLPVRRPAVEAVEAFPRATRWARRRVVQRSLLTDFVAIRANLEFLRPGDVTWSPYAESHQYAGMRGIVALSTSRITFRGPVSWETYLGERHWRQFHADFRAAEDPPQYMFGFYRAGVEIPYIVGVPGAHFLLPPDVDYEVHFRARSIGAFTRLDIVVGGQVAGHEVVEMWRRYQGYATQAELAAVCQERDRYRAEVDALTARIARMEARWVCLS